MGSHHISHPVAEWDVDHFESLNHTDRDDLTSNPASLPAILATFVPSFVSTLIFLAIFMLIRRCYPRIYSPRTYIDVIPMKNRTPSSPTARFAWVHTLSKLGDRFILDHSSLDAYLYLRFLRTIIFICFVGSCLTWPILFPVNATGGGDARQLDILGVSNVHDPKRLYAHTVVAWVFFGFIMFLIARERIWLIGLRQAWHLSKPNALRLSSRTVLYLDPPRSASLHGGLQSDFGEEAKRQWVVTTTPRLDSLVSSRGSLVAKLESAQVSFLKKANEKRSKLVKKLGSDDVELSQETIIRLHPTTRPFFGLFGTKCSAIYHARKDLQETADKVQDLRSSYRETSRHSRSAVFVEYSSQSSAQRAYRGNSKFHLPVPPNLAIQTRLIGVLPKDVLWGNIYMPPAMRLSKKSFANIVIATLIVFWSIPSAFIGSISNVNYLADNVYWLRWIKTLPDPILGLLVGLIPPLVTSELSSYVPIFMRYIAKRSGEPTTVSAELQVQAWYYAFQIIQVFFVTALGSSAIIFVPKLIQEPHQIPMILADNLPKSSNFYLTYFILQGLGSSTRNILNYSDLFQYLFYDKFINKTPRQRYNQYTSLKGISWGKVYPKFTNFAIIAIAYSCITPLVLGFACIGVGMFYLSYRHNLLFVIQPKLETKGKCYTRALQQILTGVYVGELGLIGLLGLRQATGPAIVMAILFFITIAYNFVMNRYLHPREDHFTDELLDEEPGEQEGLLSAEEGEATEQAHERSRVQQSGHGMHVPQKILDPIAQFFEPHIYASYKTMKKFLGTSEEEDPPQYDDVDIQNAYMNPSLTSHTPKVWLPADEMGLSKTEIEDNEAAEIESTEKGAWLDERARVVFDEGNLRSLPVWKEAVRY